MNAAYDHLASRVLSHEPIDREDALDLLRSHDDEVLTVLQAAFRVRLKHHGRDVRIHVLQNAKSGVCPEDCSFCSQSLKATSGVEQYGMQTADELVEGARKAYEGGAGTYCMVTATRGPSSNELKTVCEAARRIKAEMPIKVCASLGLLTDSAAIALADAGVDRFNHNLESSRRHFPQVATTHTWDDRVATVKRAIAAGMEACCGGILGMGETLEDRVDMAFELRELGVHSIPLNFLNARPGTPLKDAPQLSAADALRALAMFRLVNPTADVRVAGGREVVLGPMSPLALFAATSIFAEGYLTTAGDSVQTTTAMVKAAGFRVVEINPA